MPCNGATFNEKSVPPWTRGDFRGVGRNSQPGVGLSIGEPTPALRDGVKSSQDFTFVPPLRLQWRDFQERGAGFLSCLRPHLRHGQRKRLKEGGHEEDA
jgi:hypothetical protein